MKRKLLVALALLVVLVALAFFFVAPAAVERRVNGTRRSPPYQASERARELHRTLLVADLHADSLLWDRNLLERAARGHVDIPRLVEGGVALQVFTVVTKVPFGSNYESNDDSTDKVTPLAVAERWPLATWRSLKERALYQAWKLDDAAARSGGRFVRIRTQGDLAAFLERRKSDPHLVAGLLGVAATGGLVGIGYWDTATCGTDARAVARSIRYTANLVGVEHVALGSDFDGAVNEPFDTTGVVQVTDALLAEGFGEDEIRMIMGGNVFRLLFETLPR